MKIVQDHKNNSCDIHIHNFWTAYWEEITAAPIWCRTLTESGSVPPLIGGGACVPPKWLEATWRTVLLDTAIFFWKTWVSGKVKGWLFFTQAAHVSCKPVLCEVLNPQPLLQWNIHFPSTRWTPLLILVYPFRFAFLLLRFCFLDLLVRTFLLLRLNHVLPPPPSSWICFISMNFLLFSAILFWYLLWGKLPTPWLGA